MYSVTNPIPVERLFCPAAVRQLCRGAWGAQTDMQSLGYDCLCALAYLMPFFGCSYRSVADAQAEAARSSYSLGFVHAWDGVKPREPTDPCYHAGHVLGSWARDRFDWGPVRTDNGRRYQRARTCLVWSTSEPFRGPT